MRTSNYFSIELRQPVSRRRIGTTTVAGMIGALVLTTPAWSQEGAGSSVLEEIIVTAQFRAENVQETPIAITAISAEMLEQRSQVSIQEVAGQAPNVTMTRSSAAFGPAVSASIRGIGQYDFNPALEARCRDVC